MIDLTKWSLPRLCREMKLQEEWDGKVILNDGKPLESECGHPARSGLVCKDCIIAEIARREKEASGTVSH